MTGRQFKAFTIWIGLALGACGHGGADTATDDDPGELQALLRDDPLALPGAVARARAAATAQPLPFNPTGFWTFDDCDPGQADLFSVYGLQKLAYRSVGVACAPGILGQAVALAAQGDIVYVPDQPSFTFSDGVSVAGWFQPDGIDRTQTLVRKRDRDTSAFALVLHRGRFRFVVGLADGQAASVTAPTAARPGVFQHVAASYDGAALRLYVDGQQVAERDVTGTIASASGPLLFGNDGAERRFDGLIDEVVFDLHALSAPQMLRLTCVPADASVVATPEVSAPTPPGVPATFDIAVTNRNSPSCDPVRYVLSSNGSSSQVDVDAGDFGQVSPPLSSGGSTHFTITATPLDAALPGPYSFLYEVDSDDFVFRGGGFLTLTVSQPTGCQVSDSHELMITEPSVVADPVRVGGEGVASDPRTGAWSLRHLLEEMASTPADAPAMMEQVLRSLTVPQVINGFTVPARRGAIDELNSWPRTPDGQLDLARAPVRLTAIVNRIDLRDLDRGSGGVVSFIFTLLENGFPIDANLMFEYDLPAASEDDVVAWAQAFHALGALSFSEAYSAALQAITDRVVRRGARPDGVNGSALRAVRSNEDAFGGFGSGVSDMRQFALSPVTGRLAPVALDLTPDQSFNGSAALAGFITANRDAILAGTLTVPDRLGGQPFRAGVADNTSPIWNAPGIDGEARRGFALDTCGGCHAFDETFTFFHHVQATEDGTTPARLSPFLRGVTVPDPVTGEPRTFNDLFRRKQDLEAIVCPPAASAAAPRVSLRHGIRRIH